MLKSQARFFTGIENGVGSRFDFIAGGQQVHASRRGNFIGGASAQPGLQSVIGGRRLLLQDGQQIGVEDEKHGASPRCDRWLGVRAARAAGSAAFGLSKLPAFPDDLGEQRSAGGRSRNLFPPRPRWRGPQHLVAQLLQLLLELADLSCKRAKGCHGTTTIDAEGCNKDINMTRQQRF
jgi:hypothetical protein